MRDQSVLHCLTVVPDNDDSVANTFTTSLNQFKTRLRLASDAEATGNRNKALLMYRELKTDIRNASVCSREDEDVVMSGSKDEDEDEDVERFHQTRGQVEIGYIRCAAALQQWSVSVNASGSEASRFYISGLCLEFSLLTISSFFLVFANPSHKHTNLICSCTNNHS